MPASITAVPIIAKAILVPAPPVDGRDGLLFITFKVIIPSVVVKSADPSVDVMFTLPSLTLIFHVTPLIV